MEGSVHRAVAEARKVIYIPLDLTGEPKEIFQF